MTGDTPQRRVTAYQRLLPAIRISLQQKKRQRWYEEELLSEPH